MQNVSILVSVPDTGGEDESEDLLGPEEEEEPSSGLPAPEQPSLPKKPPLHVIQGTKKRKSTSRKLLSNKPQDFQVRRPFFRLHPLHPMSRLHAHQGPAAQP